MPTHDRGHDFGRHAVRVLRAAVVGLLLMTTVVVLGLVTSGRRHPTGASTTVVVSMHRWLGLAVVAFLGVHVVTAIADGYVDIGWLATLVPFTSSYETWQVALGTLTVDLLVAVVVTSLLRHRISERAWRTVHWLGLAAWPVALVHGFAMGTSDRPLLRGATVLCAVVGSVAIGWRLTATYADRDVRRRVTAQGWS